MDMFDEFDLPDDYQFSLYDLLMLNRFEALLRTKFPLTDHIVDNMAKLAKVYIDNGDRHTELFYMTEEKDEEIRRSICQGYMTFGEALLFRHLIVPGAFGLHGNIRFEPHEEYEAAFYILSYNPEAVSVLVSSDAMRVEHLLQIGQKNLTLLNQMIKAPDLSLALVELCQEETPLTGENSFIDVVVPYVKGRIGDGTTALSNPEYKPD